MDLLPILKLYCATFKDNYINITLAALVTEIILKQ